MCDAPIVSILVPCYNHALFLDDCLESLVSQSYENIEVIICDDCSQDNSFDIIRSWENRLRERFSRVQLLRNEANRGVTGNINKMLLLAQGEYIKLLASDDALSKNAIEAFLNFMTANPAADIVFSNGKVIGEHQKYSDAEALGRCKKIYEKPPLLEGDSLKERIYFCNELSAPCAFYRKKVFEQYGLFDESFSIEDLEFWLRLLCKGRCSFRFLDRELVLYRRNTDSITSTAINEKTERRLIRFHSAEFSILKKYREYVAPKIYAEAMLTRYLYVYSFSAANGLSQMKQMVKTEIRSFDAWKYAGASQKAFFIFQIIKADIKKGLRI